MARSWCFRIGYPIQKAITEAGIAPGPVFPSFPPDELMRRYGKLPLIHQPGERWLYNAGSEILGVLIARASGTTLSEFLRERIFDPLGMEDTAFHVPPSKLDRFATAYVQNRESQQLNVFRRSRHRKIRQAASVRECRRRTGLDRGGFQRLRADDAERRTPRQHAHPVAAIGRTDDDGSSRAEQKLGSELFFRRQPRLGFGLSVFGRRDICTCAGRFGWDGGYGTSWYSDPREQLTGILLTQRLMDSPEPPPAMTDFWVAAYQAIDD